MPQCVIHGVEMSYRPPGISKKSGKPYSASYRCGFQGCPSVEWIKDAGVQSAVPVTQTVVAPPGVTLRREDLPNSSATWKPIQQNGYREHPRKQHAISALACINSAVAAVGHLVTAKATTPEGEEGMMKRLAMEFYAAVDGVLEGRTLTFGNAPGRTGPVPNHAQAQASATVPGHFPPDPDDDINW